MATSRPASLGEGVPSEIKLVRKTLELPASRSEIVTALRQVLDLGKVQKIVVEVGKPIVYEQFVPKTDDLEELPENLVVDDLYGAMRNGEMVDFWSRGFPLDTLFFANRHLSNKKLVAKAYLYSNTSLLKTWLALGEKDEIEDIFGVPVYRHEEIPDDVLVLVAASSDEPDLVTLSLRITLDDRPDLHDESADQEVPRRKQ